MKALQYIGTRNKDEVTPEQGTRPADPYPTHTLRSTPSDPRWVKLRHGENPQQALERYAHRTPRKEPVRRHCEGPGTPPSAKWLRLGVTAEILTTREDKGVAFYVVTCGIHHRSHTWEVEHRYSEFAALHDALSKKGVPLPPMPPKSTFRKGTNAQIVAERRVALGRFVKAAVEKAVFLPEARGCSPSAVLTSVQPSSRPRCGTSSSCSSGKRWWRPKRRPNPA